MFFSKQVSTTLAFLILASTTVDGRRRRPLITKGEYEFGQNATEAEEADCAGSPDFSCKFSVHREEGVFVCRSWINKNGIERKKVGCFPSDRSILGTDECGCCGKECPTICNTCTCKTERGRAGAYIVYEGRDEPVCRSTFIATKLVHRDESIACLADCDF
ncbi:unnamed protein product [Cylindrotheca closterium]|uniref:Uncharacterized protein n=1 Tax=Cylindrotheca closterium TaxID=2856 RepID=A0AAD2FZ96_9STRA|nr:unnamed protein product [Cylindrotheca closterium]